MSKKKKSKVLDEERLKKLIKRGQSELVEVRDSVIHGSGVYAAMDITEGDKVIEYVGELIDKDESERRGLVQSAKAEKTGEAAVYIFTLSKKWDLDGSFDWNPARLINHSCDPNCEAFSEKKRIFIYAKRDIQAGEELTFDYGFGADTYADHPCRCGSEKCIGYIVGRDYHDELNELLAAAQEALSGKEKSGKSKRGSKKGRKSSSQGR